MISAKSNAYGETFKNKKELRKRIAKKRNIPLVATFHSKYYDDVYKGTIGDWVGARKYTYAHPTGFFLGVTEGDLISLGVFAGKQFVF